MKQNMRKTLIVLCIGIITLALLATCCTAAGANTENNGSKNSTKGLTAHNQIYINGNSNFMEANGVSAGNGSVDNPYIIENWDINTSSANGIDIRNTNAYFIIRNCIIHDGKSNYNDGLFFGSLKNGKIENVTSYNNFDGIRLYSSNNNIANCDVYNNYFFWVHHVPSLKSHLQL